MRTLVLFAHPAMEKSLAGRQLVKAVAGLSFVTVRDLYELYPDHQIVVEDEQALLLEHDLIILQHPFYWYSMPPLLKEWLDVVLAYGFAYGEGGGALAGKSMLTVITCGGTQHSYQPDGRNRYSIREFLRPVEQTAALCQMRYLPPLVFYGSLHLNKQQAKSWGQDYTKVVSALQDRDVSALTDDYMNQTMANLLQPGLQLKEGRDAW